MFTEDLTQFFDTGDFGIEVVFTRSALVIATVNAILDAPALETSVYDRSFYDEKHYAAKITGADVQILVIAAQAASIVRNDIATFNGGDWYVIGLEPDGTGLMVIGLSTTGI